MTEKYFTWIDLMAGFVNIEYKIFILERNSLTFFVIRKSDAISIEEASLICNKRLAFLLLLKYTYTKKSVLNVI